MLVPAHTLLGNSWRRENARCRSGRFVSMSHKCGLAAIVGTSGASQSSGSDAVKVSPMSLRKITRGIPSSHGLALRLVAVRLRQRAAFAIRPGKIRGSSKAEGQPLSGPFERILSVSTPAYQVLTLFIL